MLTARAPAKVNLVLEVLGRIDNYHRISSIVQTIDLCDALSFQLHEEIRLICDEPGLEENNLVTKATTLLRESTECGLGAQIELQKRIPWGVGLGGGSSDAATTLLALNRLWGLGLTAAELTQIASGLGSDVPFFIHQGTALVEGKGEQVSPLPSLASTYFVLLVPPIPRIAGKTKYMYGRLNAGDFTEGRYVEAAVSQLRDGKTVDGALMFNAFRKAAFDVLPQLEEYRMTMERAGAQGVFLAGSGPCLFTCCPVEEEAGGLAYRLREQGLECYLAPSFPRQGADPWL